MAMQMQRAFNAKMLTKMVWHTGVAGAYDANNDWVAGGYTAKTMQGRITAGNKFSQLQEGISVDAMPGGERLRDYMTLYCTNKYLIEHGDYVSYKGKHYRILQLSDEDTYGFRSWLVERDKNWSPA